MAATQALHGKSIAVTGAESGIGRAMALECAAQGARLSLIGLDPAGLAATAALIAAAGGAAAAVMPADITDEPRMNALFQTLAETAGLDGLAANAGLSQPVTPALDLDLAVWGRVLAVNLTGTFITLRAAARAMRARGGRGSMIVTGSSTADRPLPGFAAYGASKAGVHGLVRALAREWAPQIRVNLLVPGTTETPLTQAIPGHLARTAASLPMGEVVQPPELARMAAFALSDAAPHMTGSSLLVDSGRLLG